MLNHSLQFLSKNTSKMSMFSKNQNFEKFVNFFAPKSAPKKKHTPGALKFKSIRRASGPRRVRE